MKEKYLPPKRKNIRIIDSKKKYSSEESPYWEFMNSHRRGESGVDSDVHMIEDMDGNPDAHFSEDQHMYASKLTEEAELRLRAINEVLTTLPQQQQTAVRLCADGNTLEIVAEQMGLKVRTVRTLIQRAQAKAIKRYEWLKLQKQ